MAKKIKPCRHCYGSGKVEVSVCDECKEETAVGIYNGREICSLCWAKEVGDEIDDTI